MAVEKNSEPDTRVSHHHDSDIMDSRLFQLLTQVYGPYGFGLASLLLIWFTIVSPELARNSIDYKKSEEIIESMRGIISSQEVVSRQLERTAIILAEIVDKVYETNGVSRRPTEPR